MRRLSPPLVLLLLGLMLPASAGGGGDVRSAGHAAAGHFYFGRIAFEDDVIGIALGRGNRAKIFVTDAEPGGDAEWFEGRLVRSKLRLRSASGRARLRATFDRNGKTWSGTIRLRSGRTRRLAAFHADGGAGLYDVRVNRRGRYRGRSTAGQLLRARRSGRFLAGTITEPAGSAGASR